jgi:metal-responsive CopG/Arc/MetJ family transcriptional regulator
MAKVNVSLPDELLEEVDELAEETHESRSGFVREATSRYVAEVRAEAAERERRERIGRAIKSMRETAKRIPPGSLPAEEQIRKDRDRDGRRSES